MLINAWTSQANTHRGTNAPYTTPNSNCQIQSFLHSDWGAGDSEVLKRGAAAS